jgi:hypothetical protein
MAFLDHLQQVFMPHYLLNPTDAAISAFLDVLAKIQVFRLGYKFCAVFF